MQVDRTQEQVAWAAGLFEGEGWWGPRAKTSAEAVLGSTDRDVVDRFASVVGFGSIATEKRADGHKTLYRWSASSASQVKSLIELFWPWLGNAAERTRRPSSRPSKTVAARTPLRRIAPRAIRMTRRTPTSTRVIAVAVSAIGIASTR
jgi:hypothetical protein